MPSDARSHDASLPRPGGGCQAVCARLKKRTCRSDPSTLWTRTRCLRRAAASGARDSRSSFINDADPERTTPNMMKRNPGLNLAGAHRRERAEQSAETIEWAATTLEKTGPGGGPRTILARLLDLAPERRSRCDAQNEQRQPASRADQVCQRSRAHGSARTSRKPIVAAEQR